MKNNFRGLQIANHHHYNNKLIKLYKKKISTSHISN